eukprot:CAMPEP_0198685444 /NCGR_PEP_ID=MMETSP1468-20131203/13652_1 /TAXON_ID=1461545 /ORGANISM="Mantoniella sp, Strain CCMP1436" /LENGTH=138 /DNA_ID=CAMNT_0044430933 /DNA_START=479 /DNA_END=892 /DNA_ORIENTATION=+
MSSLFTARMQHPALTGGKGQTVALLDTGIGKKSALLTEEILCGSSTNKIILTKDIRPQIDQCLESSKGLAHSERVIMFGFSSECITSEFHSPGGPAKMASVAHIAVKDTLYVGRKGQTRFTACDVRYFVHQLSKALDW